jgi:hypothetical protein
MKVEHLSEFLQISLVRHQKTCNGSSVFLHKKERQKQQYTIHSLYILVEKSSDKEITTTNVFESMF